MRLLPPAYGVRREGYVLTRVCLSVHRGGGQVQPGGGGQVQRGGGQVQPGGVRSSQGGSDPAGGVRSSQPGGVRSSWGGSGPAGQGEVRSSWGGGSAKIGQHREYLLHGGRYASCVHAGGLSCLIMVTLEFYRTC